MMWQDTTDKVISKINEKHFVVEENGKTRVYNEKYDRVLKRHCITISTFSDFKNLYMNQYAEREKIVGGKPSITFQPKGDYWLAHPERRQYDEIIFDPGAKDTPGVKNLWRGFDIDENENGSWELLQHHILDNICCGDVKHFNYYLDWMANAVQFPGQQGNVVIVLKGARGTGKGTAIGYFAELFGQHYIYVVSAKQVTGNFNLHLRDAVVLFSDEAVYAGDPAAASVLKGMTTEKYLPIEGKGVDLVMAKNCLHIIMATNSQWAVPAGIDERRFFVLNVRDDPAVKQNTSYFNAIRLQMDNGGRGRLLYDLLRRDISKFDSYTSPRTIGLLEQKIESFEGVQAWWYSKLSEGEFFDGVKWPLFLPKEALYNDFLTRTKNTGHSRYNAGQISFGLQLQRMLPEGWPKTHKLKADKWYYDAELLVNETPQKNHYEFPPLDKCREHFESVIGQIVNWPIVLQPEQKSVPEAI